MKFRNILIPFYILLSIHFISAVELPVGNPQLEEYRELLKFQSQAKASGDYGIPDSDTLFSSYKTTSTQISGVKKYFGYDYFTNRNSIEIWDNLPASRDYILGPGDEVIINIWGDTQVTSNHIIDRQGKLFLDKIGLISLSGNTLGNAKEIFISRLSTIYSTLSGKNPTSSLDISLGELKSINISIVGEAESPGLHKVHPFSTLTTCLFQVGGVKESGTLRDIQVYRNNKLFKSFDFYTFFTDSHFSQDIQLKDGDVISISNRIATVEIQGSITRPAYYEVEINESIDKLIQYAGGLTSSASGTVVVDRISIKDKIQYLKPADWDGFVIKNGDIVTVYERPLLIRSVAIYGQVKLPGEYPFSDKMNILELLSIAGGIDDPTFLESMYLKKAQVVRRSSSEEYPKVVLVDLEKVIKGIPEHNIELQNLDVIIINQNPNYESPQRIDIMGEINVPGVYTVQKNGETLSDILHRAGGFTSRAFEDGIQMYRDSSQVVLQEYDIVVRDGDSLHVPQHPGIVFVKGEVYNPGLIQFKKGKSLGDYIESAGGFNIFADNRRIAVFYANGDVKIKKWYSNPKIKEGATIVVYAREIGKPVDFTEFAKNISSIIASFTTVIILINQ